MAKNPPHSGGRRKTPTPAGLQSPSRWGTKDGPHELFDHGVEALRIERQEFVWRFASAQQYLDLFRAYYGPIHKAFAALDGTGQAALARDLIATKESIDEHHLL